MPNMLMSTALAHFYLHNEQKGPSSEAHLKKGTEMLRECLIRFPALLLDLLDKCGVMPDKQVESHWIFSRVSHLKVPVGLKYLIGLYCSRMYHEWKIGDNLAWLEKTVKEIIRDETTLKPQIEEYKKKYEIFIL